MNPTNNMNSVQKLTLAGILIALGVVGSAFYIPVGASKCMPVQHMVNVIAAMVLGPWYGVGMAFASSLIRVLLSTGSLLAFPGSMCGALLAGLLFHYRPKIYMAVIGEVVGTGIIGALLASPIAVLLMGQEATLFGFVVPFMVSSAGGAVIAGVFAKVLKRTGLLVPKSQHN